MKIKRSIYIILKIAMMKKTYTREIRLKPIEKTSLKENNRNYHHSYMRNGNISQITNELSSKVSNSSIQNIPFRIQLHISADTNILVHTCGSIIESLLYRQSTLEWPQFKTN